VGRATNTATFDRSIEALNQRRKTEFMDTCLSPYKSQN
jgi:hypothetical protein